MFMMKKIKGVLFNQDGSLNGKMLASLISLGLVLIQQVLAIFGLRFTGDIGDIVGAINTVLTILGILGVVEDNGTVTFIPKQ